MYDQNKGKIINWVIELLIINIALAVFGALCKKRGLPMVYLKTNIRPKILDIKLKMY